MNKEIKKFIKICKRDQFKLKAYLYGRLKEFGYEPISEDGFILAKGSDIMVTAHMDTVHKECVKDVKIETVKQYNKRIEKDNDLADKLPKTYKYSKAKKIDADDNYTVISSPQGIGGDDRSGVYMILRILEDGYRPTVLFCEDEEIGGVGSNKFVKTKYADILKEMKYLIELDRKGKDDAVFYDCGNKDFKDYIIDKTKFVEEYGSFSDIGHLSPAGDVASVNLSCGYYNAHTTSEYVIFEQMSAVIGIVKILLNDEKNVEAKFDYQEDKWTHTSKYGKYAYDSWYDSYYTRGSYGSYKYDDEFYIYYSIDGKDYIGMVEASNVDEALGVFMYENPDLRICYNDIVGVFTYDEFYDAFGYDPYDDLKEAEDEQDETEIATDDFDTVNEFILNDNYELPQQDMFVRVV